jgi:hypothetical protein
MDIKSLQVIDPRKEQQKAAEAKSKGVKFGAGQYSDIVKVFQNRVYILGIYIPKIFPVEDIRPGITTYELYVWAKPEYEKTLTRAKITQIKAQLKSIAGQRGDSGFFASEQFGGVLIKGTALIGGFALGVTALGAATGAMAGAASSAAPIIATAKPAGSLFAGLEGFGGKIAATLSTLTGKLGAAAGAGATALTAKAPELFSKLIADKTKPKAEAIQAPKVEPKAQAAGGFPLSFILLGGGGIVLISLLLKRK